MSWFGTLIRRILQLFSGKRHAKIGIFGPPNSGKTTLANRICADWLGEEMGATSKIAHETRQVRLKEKITIATEHGQKLTFSLADTPGIATHIDYHDFIKAGMSEEQAKQRAKEAVQGVTQSVDWLTKVDCVLFVLDSTKDPYNQVNSNILSKLDDTHTPHLLVANKIDLKQSRIQKIHDAYPGAQIIGVSAKHGDNIDKLYLRIIELAKKVS